MESWDVLVIGTGPSALRAAIASCDSGANTAIIHQSPGPIISPPTAGLAASLGETTPEAHIQDTIALGDESTNENAVRRTCASSVEILSELERWGMILRRDKGGLPHLSSVPGHASPRLSGAGDATSKYITQILDEQVLKRSIQRRQNHIPLSLVMDNSQIRGIVALDLLDGKVKPYQCKTIILADEGYQGLWSNPSIGSGNAIAMAIRAGINPQNLHKVPLHPMVIRGTDIPIPFEILGVGGRYRSESGDDIDPLNHEGDAVVDMRFVDEQHSLWFDSIRKTILDSTGLDVSIDVIPVTHQVMETTGGIPVDEKGRVTIESGKMWATGVYAACPSASTGFHTSSILPGNTMLEKLYTGALAGKEAGKWSLNCDFGGSKNILQSLDSANKRIEDLYKETGDSVGAAETKLTTQAKSFLTGSATIESLIETAEKTAEAVRTTTNTRVMNQEIVGAIRVQDLGTIAASFAM